MDAFVSASSGNPRLTQVINEVTDAPAICIAPAV